MNQIVQDEQYARALQSQEESQVVQQQGRVSSGLPYPIQPLSANNLYPSLSEYMGMDVSNLQVVPVPQIQTPALSVHDSS